MKPKSQTEQIIDYLNEGNSITAIEALQLFKCFRLASRMNDIKRLGYTFTTETIETYTKKKVARYSFPNAVKQNDEKPLLCEQVKPKQRIPEYGC